MLIVLAACSSNEPEAGSAPSPSPSSSATFINGGHCPPADSGDLPEYAGCVTIASNEEATVTVYAFLDKDSFPTRWMIRYGSGEEMFEDRLDAGNPFSYPRALAAIDVNGDGEDEWLIKNVDLAGHGTNWQRLELLVLEGDRLVPVTVDGELLYVNVAGISRMGEGARCEGGHFFLLRTWALDRQNTTWAYSEREYEIEGSEARLLDRHEGRLHLSDYNDPKLDPYYRLECEGYVYPPPVS